MRFTNDPVTPPLDRPVSPMQAGTTPSRSETHVETWRCAGDSRGTTAPCDVAQLVRCGGGWGGARHRRPAPRWVDVTKAYQTRCYGFVPPFYSPFGHDQAYNRISGQMSTKPTWRRLAPLVLGLGRRLGGGAAPRSFDHQIRAHGQIHRHVSFMNASGVQIIGGELQVSRPAWCPPPPHPRRPASVWTSSDATQSLFEQMSLCPQADSFSS